MALRVLAGVLVVVGAWPASAPGQILPPKREDPPPQAPVAPAPRPRLADPPAELRPAETETILRFDSSERVIEIRGCIDAAALKRNTLISAADWERIRPALDRWQRIVDDAVVDNIDLMQEFEHEGILLDLSHADPSLAAQVQVMYLALSGGNALDLSTWLQAEGVITGEQQARCRQMVTQYKQALSRQWNDDLSFDPAGQEARQAAQAEFQRKQLLLNLHDQRRSIRRMLLDASTRFDELVSHLDLTDEQRAAFRAVQDLPPGTDPDTRYMMMGNAFWSMTRPQQQQVLRALLASSPPRFHEEPGE